MARKPMVTRKLVTTTASCTVLEVAKQKTCNKSFTLPREYKDNAKLLKVLQKIYNTEEYKVVYVVDVKTEEKLYGMTEKEFIDHSIELDQETRKPKQN